MAVGTLDSIPSLKPGVNIEHLRDVISPEERAILIGADGKTPLRLLAEQVGVAREAAREAATRLVARNLLLLLAPEEEDRADREAERTRVVPGMRYLDGLDDVPLKGVIRRDEMAKLVVKLHLDRVTGILRVARPKRAPEEADYYKNVYVREGRIIDCRTHPFQAGECLGRVLQRSGRLDEKVVVQSLKLVKERGLLQGQALVEMGAVSPRFLEVALQSQLEIKVAEVLEWDGPAYEFAPKPEFSDRVARIESRLPYLLFNAIWKRYPLPALIERVDRYREKYVGKAEKPPFGIDEFQFERIFGKFWEEILDRDMPLKRLLIVSNQKKEQTYRAIFGLCSTGMIEFLLASREDPMLALAAKLEGQLKNIERRSYFDALTVHWSADGEMIDRAYAKRMDELKRASAGADGLARHLYDQILRLTEKAYDAIRTPEGRKSYREKIYDPYFLEFNSDIFRQKGESFLFTKDEYGSAIEELESAIEVYPREGEYFALLGLALFYKHYPRGQDEMARARELVAKGARMHARSDVVHLCEGLMLKREGRFAEATRALARAVELNKHNRFAEVELQSLTRGVTEKERAEAIQSYLDSRAPKKGEEE